MLGLYSTGNGAHSFMHVSTNSTNRASSSTLRTEFFSKQVPSQMSLVTHICNPSTKWGEGWCLRDGSVVKSEDYSHRGPKSLVCSTQVRQLTATIPVPGIEHLWCPCALVCGMLEHACVHTHTYTHKANIFFFLYHNLLFLSIISLREVFYWSIC